MSNLIWIDTNIDNSENTKYSKELQTIKSLKEIKLFKKLDEAFDYMKIIKFEDTIIIVSGRFYSELVEKFKKKIIDMFFIPIIIVFTSSKSKFLEFNIDYEYYNNKFYAFGGIATQFEQIKNYLNKDLENNKDNYSFFDFHNLDESENIKNLKPMGNKKENIFFNNSNEPQLTIEFLDKKEQLLLPLFFKSLINDLSNEDIEKYTNLLYMSFSQDMSKTKLLFGSISSIPNIPIEILTKYYIRLYTAESNFFWALNRDLRLNKVEKYLSFIKIIYKGIQLKALPLVSKNHLYRISMLSNEEINKIKQFIKIKNKGFQSVILFSKSFLYFSKDKNIVKNFKNVEYNNINLSKVLFSLEKDSNLEYNISTHCDVEKISFDSNNKEVLFFPFSAFEIRDIKEITIEKEKIYEIKLVYLNKYLKDIENDKGIIINENKIPDSEFKKQLLDFGLIQKEILLNIKTENLYNSFKQYENIINAKNEVINNIIISQIIIDSNKVNKEIQIISSFEHFKRMDNLSNFNKNKEEFENEKEIKQNIEIKINNNNIGFSFYHIFDKEGIYTIEYRFKNLLTNLNHLFYDCEEIINLNFSNLNTQNVTNMNGMFQNCKALKALNLSNLNTQNITDMNSMFFYCNSLSILNLSYFNTKKVTDMYLMFGYCESLLNLNISSFNTQNVKNMSRMFEGCNSIINIDLTNFNTQNVQDMSYMFYECGSLVNLNVTSFNTKKVVKMDYMFERCKSLMHLDLSNFNTKNVENMKSMFGGCSSLIKLDLLNFNIQNVADLNNLFFGCTSLKKNNIITKDKNIKNLLKD